MVVLTILNPISRTYSEPLVIGPPFLTIEIWGVDGPRLKRRQTFCYILGQRSQNVPPQHVSNIFERYGDGSISGGPYPAIPTMLV